MLALVVLADIVVNDELVNGFQYAVLPYPLRLRPERSFDDDRSTFVIHNPVHFAPDLPVRDSEAVRPNLIARRRFPPAEVLPELLHHGRRVFPFVDAEHLDVRAAVAVVRDRLLPVFVEIDSLDRHGIPYQM